MGFEIARHWRLKKQRYNLEGTMCQNCGTKQFPPGFCYTCADLSEETPRRTNGNGHRGEDVFALPELSPVQAGNKNGNENAREPEIGALIVKS